jgi:hypothetical protein
MTNPWRTRSSRADPQAANRRIAGEARGDNPTTHMALHIAARKNLPRMIALPLDMGGRPNSPRRARPHAAAARLRDSVPLRSAARKVAWSA